MIIYKEKFIYLEILELQTCDLATTFAALQYDREGEGEAREDGREEAKEATDVLIASFHSE